MRYWAIFAIGLCLTSTARARDPDGKYAQANPELHKWFETLKSGKGPCCADADGAVVKDADWESHDGHYRVRIEVNQYGSWVKEPAEGSHSEWVDIPDEAIVNQPNLFGRTVVWPMYLNGRVTIRCFMPGSEG